MHVRKSTTPEPGAFERGLAGSPVAVALEVDVAAPPERVWHLLCRVERWTAWHPGIDVAVLRGEAPAPGVQLDWRADGMRIRSVVLEALEPGAAGPGALADPGSTSAGRLEWTLRMMGATGAQRWTLLPLPDGGTSVRVEEWWTGITPRLLRRTLQRTLDVARAAWLERLRHRAERPPSTPGDSGKEVSAP
jgi:hypothetical protein